mmetsp:Transcript_53495/g.135083  ORF Transcript_53495/g.135083 Transcript_53495/m.135083 type:complete len:227 (+) Transcript_53495:216-896(+)
MCCRYPPAPCPAASSPPSASMPPSVSRVRPSTARTSRWIWMRYPNAQCSFHHPPDQNARNWRRSWRSTSALRTSGSSSASGTPGTPRCKRSAGSPPTCPAWRRGSLCWSTRGRTTPSPPPQVSSSAAPSWELPRSRRCRRCMSRPRPWRPTRAPRGSKQRRCGRPRYANLAGPARPRSTSPPRSRARRGSRARWWLPSGGCRSSGLMPRRESDSSPRTRRQAATRR